MAENKEQARESFAAPVKTNDLTADLRPANSGETRQRAERLPEKNDVQKAYKDALTTDDPHKQDRAYLRAAELSPDAMDTPSGYALKESIGESNDTKRGEKYARAKTARRWGYVPVDDES